MGVGFRFWWVCVVEVEILTLITHHGLAIHRKMTCYYQVAFTGGGLLNLAPPSPHVVRKTAVAATLTNHRGLVCSSHPFTVGADVTSATTTPAQTNRG